MSSGLFNITEESMSDLVKLMPNSAHIKNIQNGKYLATNVKNLCTYGFTKESEFTGLTFDDLNGFMIPHWGAPFVETIKQFDEKVHISGKTGVLKNLVFKDKNNFVRYQDLYKIPIYHKRQTTKANLIFTITIEYTDKIPQRELYEKYKELNTSKADAIMNFMRYLDIEKFFYEPLTDKELLCLLSAKYNQAHKCIARDLNINIKTVETHLGNIADKLKNTTLQSVIAALRK
jgi:DNA-binding CsgD family transcriptional regulator